LSATTHRPSSFSSNNGGDMEIDITDFGVIITPAFSDKRFQIKL